MTEMSEKAKNSNQPISMKALIEKEFSRRRRSNPNYSLRAFAKFLGVDQSNLTKFLAGRRKFSREINKKIGAKLGLTSREIDLISTVSERAGEYGSLENQQFEMISDWLHFALRAYLRLASRPVKVSYIADALSVDEEEVIEAFERMESLGMVERTVGGWMGSSTNFRISNFSTTSIARKALQKQIGQKSLDALEKVDFSARQHSGLMVNCSRSLIPEVKQKIAEFQMQLDEFIESKGPHDDIYQLSVSFFPLTDFEKTQEQKK